jgi:hypothetical protein
MIKYRVFKDKNSVRAEIADGSLQHSIMQGIDFGADFADWEQVDCQGTVFIGCSFEPLEIELLVRRNGALVIPRISGLPYDPFRTTLYTPAELMAGYDVKTGFDGTFDARVYKHFKDHGGHDADILEALTQRIHDFSIDTAIKELLAVIPETGLPSRKAVGVMGGHRVRRDEEAYRKTVEMAALMTREGYFIVSGGGPGIMEAANVGAYLANAGPDAIDRAIEILAKVPNFAQDDGGLSPGYITQAQAVLKEFPKGEESLAIPTWFYGHEPVNLFASQIGKYFSNSIREDGLLSICVYGIIYSPGAAATTQEVFADAAQNHYGTFDYYSPMTFLGTTHYLQSQIYSCLTQQAAGNTYAQMITISDEPAKLLKFFKDHPPIPTPQQVKKLQERTKK